jgi:DNA-binding helix-hairpin-helix protein with protein kinase domain
MLYPPVRIDHLRLGQKLGAGGEASVYALESEPKLVAKVYHKPDDFHGRKIELMVSSPPQCGDNKTAEIAWPLGRILSSSGTKTIGFLMPKVTGGIPASQLHNMRSRLQTNPHFNWKYLVRTARNTALAMAGIHGAGYVIGDVNDGGILVAPTARVSLVDCDSFQVRGPNGLLYRCTVGVDMYTPSELIGLSFSTVDRSPNHDAFGLGVLIYQLLMGMHPYSVRVDGFAEQPTLAEAISKDLYFDATSGRAKIARFSVPVEVLPSDIRALFRRTFTRSNGGGRPIALDWEAALSQLEGNLRQCARRNTHFYASHLGSDCPWCERADLLDGRDPFPTAEAISRNEHLKPRRPRPQTGPQPPVRTAATTDGGRSDNDAPERSSSRCGVRGRR